MLPSSQSLAVPYTLDFLLLVDTAKPILWTEISNETNTLKQSIHLPCLLSYPIYASITGESCICNVQYTFSDV